MDINEIKIRHLEMIQRVIDRLAGNSLAVKGFTITLITAVVAFVLKDYDWPYFFLTFGVSFILMLLDCYYLSLERSFRKYFEEIANQTDKEHQSLSMKAMNGKRTSFFKTLTIIKSPSIYIFYGLLFTLQIVLVLII